MHYLVPPVCSVKLDRDRNSVMKKSDIEHMVNSSLLYAGFSTLYTVHGKILAGKKLVNLTNHELFTKIFLANIHRYTKNVFGTCTNCSLYYLPIFSLPISFMFHQNLFPPYISHVHYLHKFKKRKIVILTVCHF